MSVSPQTDSPGNSPQSPTAQLEIEHGVQEAGGGSNVIAPAAPADAALQRGFSVFKFGAFKEHAKQFNLSAKSSYLVKDVLPRKAIAILFGDSGLGKSPLLHQLGLCVANGLPFIGYETKPARVLVMDFENGVGEVEEMVEGLCRHLGIPDPGDNFYMWNLNSSSTNYGKPDHSPFDIMKEAKCDLIICDPIAALAPKAENSNTDANLLIQSLRKVTRHMPEGTTLLGVHHLKKPSDLKDFGREGLNETNVKKWLEQARGPRSLINSIDVRLAVDDAPKTHPSPTSAGSEPALVFGGFGRVRGNYPLITVARVYDEEGLPIGYERCSGIHMLENVDMIDAYRRLPTQFTWSDAARIYQKGGGATTNFLQKCISLRLLAKSGRVYEKLSEA